MLWVASPVPHSSKIARQSAAWRRHGQQQHWASACEFLVYRGTVCRTATVHKINVVQAHKRG